MPRQMDGHHPGRLRRHDREPNKDARVYTVCDESRYLIVRNVPALKCADDLRNLFALHGDIVEFRRLDEEECEPFTEAYWIKYAKISNARFSKRKLDDYNFLSNLLQVSYAPDYETLEDTQEKLEERRSDVLRRGSVNSAGSFSGLRLTTSRPSTEHQTPGQDPLLASFSSSSVQKHYAPAPSQHHAAATALHGNALAGEQTRAAGAGTSTSTQLLTPSMHETVQSVRHKLDQIANTEQQPLAAQGRAADKHLPSPGQPGAKTTPAAKRPRLDNRRRI